MLNSSHVQRKIQQGPKLRSLLQANKSTQEIVNDLYLTILSRWPTEEELKIITAYSQSGTAPGRESLVDLAWALFNSEEFLHRH
jgi:hypothetical protein